MKWNPTDGEWRTDVYHLPGRGLRRGKLEPRPKEEIQRIILHHTGSGVLSRFKRDKDKAKFLWNDPLEAASHVYTRIMDSSGHYTIGYRGEIVQYVPERFAAWHAGYGGQRRSSRLADKFTRMWYDRMDRRMEPLWFAWNKRRYDWWQDRWYNTYGYRSPTRWFPKLGTNLHSIGIELLTTPGKEPFHEEQLNALHDLLTAICGDYGIPMDRNHILTHSDVCPLARTSRSGSPWDPPPSKIDPFLDDLFK